MDIIVQPLEPEHLPEARRLFRLAFGKFLGMADPGKFAPGVDFYGPRRIMFPEGAWGAFDGDRLVGSVITSRWGTLGFFGPLTVDPEYWDRGLGQRLLAPVMDCFTRWETQLEGLYTFSSSPKHLALYQKFGFYPDHLVSIMSKPIEAGSTETLQDYRAYSRLAEAERAGVLESCRSLTGEIYAGLDLTREIEIVAEKKLGEVLVLGDGSETEAFAVCHQGTGTEAGTMGTYVKFGAVRPGPEAGAIFRRLVLACESYARMKGAPRVILGINTGRRGAYQALLDDGYRIETLGVSMYRTADGAPHVRSDYVIADLR